MIKSHERLRTPILFKQIVATLVSLMQHLGLLGDRLLDFYRWLLQSDAAVLSSSLNSATN